MARGGRRRKGGGEGEDGSGKGFGGRERHYAGRVSSCVFAAAPSFPAPRPRSSCQRSSRAWGAPTWPLWPRAPPSTTVSTSCSACPS
eukprot:12794420-Alexandrium_andersonii.AAC.1